MTKFVSRHPVIVHQAIVAIAFSTYFIQRDDIVWQFVKNSRTPVKLERILFAISTLLVGVGAVVCTRRWRSSKSFYRDPGSTAAGDRKYGYGELLYAAGLGSLAPLTGFVVLVGGEALRIFRLRAHRSLEPTAIRDSDSTSRRQFSAEFAKWGIFIAMIVFTVTLNDRVVEILASGVFTIAIALNSLPLVSSRRN